MNIIMIFAGVNVSNDHSNFQPLSLQLFVIGSVKTGHNRTSLNLQYKALNTLGAYLHIVEEIRTF